MNPNINKILNDLYIIDPDFKKQEKELIKIIKKLINEKPNTKFDENFARELKIELLKKAEELKNKKTLNIFNLIFMKKSYYILGGVAVIILVIATSLSLTNINKKSELALDSSSFTKLKAGAFGSLASLTQDTQNLSTNSIESATTAKGLGGGGSAISAPLATDSVEGKMIIPPYYSTRYEYEYTGEEFTINQNTMEVYRRIKKLPNANSLDSVIGNINLNLIDLNSFSNSKLQNLSFAEDKDFGLIVGVNPLEGIISIYQNWEKWPNVFENCREESCYNNLRLKIDQVPTDEEAIQIADDFVQKYGINMSSYGKSQVDNRWRATYAQTENTDVAYVPDSISVIYPLIINDKQIYDSSGNVSGLQVNIDIRNKKTSGAWNIISNNYETSEYEVEQDTSKILKLAKQGGQNIYYNDEFENVVVIKLGDPELIYIKYYKYDSKASEELLIPALKFPITKKPQNTYFENDNIIVPLVKEILDEKMRDDATPTPRPLIEPAVLENTTVSN